MNIHQNPFQPAVHPSGLDLCRIPAGREIRKIRDAIREKTGQRPPKDNDAVLRKAAELGIIRPSHGFVIGEG